MDIIAPNHVADYCVLDGTDKTLNYLMKEYAGELSYVYKIKCSCKFEKFNIYEDEHPTIVAQCCNCNKRITLYELSYYPAATKLNENFKMKATDFKEVNVYVNYEYSDDFMYEEDIEFNNNDITWAKAFVKKGDQTIKILDDETA